MGLVRGRQQVQGLNLEKIWWNDNLNRSRWHILQQQGIDMRSTADSYSFIQWGHFVLNTNEFLDERESTMGFLWRRKEDMQVQWTRIFVWDKNYNGIVKIYVILTIEWGAIDMLFRYCPNIAMLSIWWGSFLIEMHYMTTEFLSPY